MNANVIELPAPRRTLLSGLSAADALREICRGMGIAPLTAAEAANLPPWTDEEAAAFERVISETSEQIEEPRTLA